MFLWKRSTLFTKLYLPSLLKTFSRVVFLFVTWLLILNILSYIFRSITSFINIEFSVPFISFPPLFFHKSPFNIRVFLILLSFLFSKVFYLYSDEIVRGELSHFIIILLKVIVNNRINQSYKCACMIQKEISYI